MKVLAIYPALNPKVNDIAHALAYLARQGFSVRVITAKSNKSKSSVDSVECEDFDGVRIHRPYDSFFPEMILWPRNKTPQIESVLREFIPDVILCSQEFSVNLGLIIKKILGDKPKMVVISEFAGELADRGYQGLVANLIFPLAGMPRGRRFWGWLKRQTDAVITCYPFDQHRLGDLGSDGKPVYYAPWCNELPPDIQSADERDKELAVYIGTFSQWKNTDEFEKLVPEIINRTSTKKFIFVGKGRTRVLETLRRKYGQSIGHIPGLPRKEALEILSKAYYGITPVKRGGWGFYGDCWGLKTPVVSLYNDYDLHHLGDAIVGYSVDGVIEGINQLQNNPILYKAIQAKGVQRYLQNHTSAAVGTIYKQVIDGLL